MMIDPTSVAFDIDGVVADTMSLFIDIARREFNLNSIRYEDITSYTLADCLDIQPEIIDDIVSRILDGNYSATLNPIAGAPKVLSQLGKHYGPVLFVTARPYLGPIREWIDQMLRLTPGSIDVIATGSHEAKAGILQKRKVSYFVEDRLETCFVLEHAGVQPILFKQPWNRQAHPFVEVNSWNELQAMMAF